MKQDTLARVPFFANLPPDEIEYLAVSLHPCELPAGTLVFQEDQLADKFYVMLDGQVEIIKALGTRDERTLGMRGPGSLLGEMSLLSSAQRYTASVRACADLQLLEMTRDDFDALLHRQPDLAYNLLKVMSARLNQSENLTIRDLQEKNRQLAQAYEELKAAQVQLIEKEKLETELRVARDLQRNILPRVKPRLTDLDFGMLIEPMTSVGGDFFDFIELDQERVGLVIGDVSDHGVPAAIFMALTYSLLRSEAFRASSPSEALQVVNRQLLDMNPSGMFVTVLYGVLNRTTRDFQFARAGHDLPLILDARREVVNLTAGVGQLLGLFPNPRIDEQHLTLPAESLVLMYTDGVTEAMDATGDLFGEERLRAVLYAGRNPTAQAACEAVLAEVREFSDYAAQRDDITVIALQVK
jgi:phosphoserine phosphatase RsbU/P